MRAKQTEYQNFLGAVFFTVGIFIALPLFGCQQKEEIPRPMTPQVTVIQAIQKKVPIFLDFVGTMRAIQEVEIRARVKGYLIKRAFRDGADVKAGDLLFVIDPREYKAELERNLAQLAKDRAALTYARSQVKRYKPLTEQELTAEDTFENYRTIAKEKEAAVKADQAALELARLNLSYATVKAPLSGRIGRGLVDVGNLVGAGEETLLATIRQMDPIYVYFSPGERQIPLISKYHGQENLQVTVTLADSSTYPHPGTVDFIDNKVDPATGTITMRALVPNPEKSLVPGQYVQVRLRLTENPNALVIPEKTVGTDQGGSFVYVVGPDQTVEQRYVETGAKFQNGLLVVDRGLKAGEQVIIEGLQRVRPGLKVEAKLAATKDDARAEASEK